MSETTLQPRLKTMKRMPTRRRSRALFPTLALALAATAAFATSACDDSTGPDEAKIVGTWNVTSFQLPAPAGDVIAQGMTMTIMINGSATAGTYHIQVTNDVIEICEGASSCTDDGDYTATSSQITLNPDDPESITVFSFTIQGETMTWVGTIDSIPVTITLEKA